MGQNGSQMCFPNNDLGASGVPKQVKSAHLEPIVSHFGPSKVTNCLENGLCWDQKMGQKSINSRCLSPLVYLPLFPSQAVCFYFLFFVP